MSDFVGQMHQSVIRAAFSVRHGHRPYGRLSALLEQSQYWPWPRLQEMQVEKLTRLIQHAYEDVPFYRRRFDLAGVQPASVKAVEDLGRLPILTKHDIQTHLTDLIARDVDRARLLENHTGGSTGEPLTFYQDANFSAWSEADKLRCYRMAGYQLGQRWAFLWGSDYDGQAHRGWRGRLGDRVVYNLMWINTFDLTADTLERAAAQLALWRPQMLVAYVSSATLLARLIVSRELPPLQLRTIQTSAEVLTPADRQLLEATFNCPVFDRYGCREVNNIAHECERHRGRHILAENNVVEVVDDAGRPVGPGQLGRIVLTNLNNHAMPLIRYEVGDLGIAADAACDCGRELPMLKTIIGRTTDVITSPSGRLLHGEFFTHLFYKVTGVQQFRVLQLTRRDLLIEIVPAPNFDQARTLAFLENTIHQHGDVAFKVEFALRDGIPASASGKYRFTQSEVALNIANDQR